MADRFYLVERDSETHKKIDEMFVRRDAAIDARWKFIEREFPQAKRKTSGFRLASFTSGFGSGSYWAIQPPNGFEMPADWKFNKNSETWSPRHSTKRGKQLHAEMMEKIYYLPSASDIGDAIGSPSKFVDMRFIGIGVTKTECGHWLLTLHEKHKVPKFAARISDIEAEKLLEPADKRAAKSKRKKAEAGR